MKYSDERGGDMKKHIIKARPLLVLLLLILSVGLITACGKSAPEITGAADLAEANKTAQAEVESYHLDGDIGLEMKLNMEGMESALGTSELSMPINMKMALDSGKESAHGDMTMDLSMLGQSTTQKAEMYIDIKNGVTYTKQEGASSWTESSQQMDLTAMAPNFESLGEDVLKQAEFSEEENDYVLKLDANVMESIITENGLLEQMDLEAMELKDLKITGGNVVYRFDKDTALVKNILMEGVTISAGGNTSGMDFDIDMTMDTDMAFSKYNELKPEDYQIPDEVKNASGSSGGTKAASSETPGQTTETSAAETTLPPAETQLILDGDSTPNDQGWYTVGTDVPEGNYKLFHGDGQGVLWIKEVNVDDEARKWNIGYTANDELKDGTEVHLGNGEIVIITNGLQVVFDPVN